MSLEYLHSLSSSSKTFELTQNQLNYIAMENKISIKTIESIQNNQKLKILDLEQLCTLIHQNNESKTMKETIQTTVKSTDKLHHNQQRIYLNVEQIFSLAKNSNIKLSQLKTCTSEHIDVSDAKKDVFFPSDNIFLFV